MKTHIHLQVTTKWLVYRDRTLFQELESKVQNSHWQSGTPRRLQKESIPHLPQLLGGVHVP